MNTQRTVHLTLALILVASAQAQFPLLNTSQGSIVQLKSLGSGTRFIQMFNDASFQRTIYNLDLSVHRVLNYPLPPSGMEWSNMGYITEELFDNDPSTIEFTLVARSTDMPGGNFATFVYREDGAELFAQAPGSLVAGIGSYLGGFEPIFTVDDQTYMVVHEQSIMGPPVRIYALPGSLPCMDCRDAPTTSNLGLGVSSIVDVSTGMTLQPNPARNEVLVTLSAASRAADAVSVMDSAGRQVLTMRVTDPARIVLSVAGLASGSYVVVVTHDGQRLGAQPLVVE